MGWAWLDNAANRQVRFHTSVSSAAIEVVPLLAWHMTQHTENFIQHRHVLFCIYALCLMAPSIYIICSAGCVRTMKVMMTLRLLLPPMFCILMDFSATYSTFVLGWLQNVDGMSASLCSLPVYAWMRLLLLSSQRVNQ